MHTPTPWMVTAEAPREIRSSDGALVAKLTALDLPNAAHIVKCVNAFPELVAALKETASALNSARLIMADKETRDMAAEMVERARAALAKAGE